MKAAHFDYARAHDAAHAVSLLSHAEGFAKPVAGAQSLGPMLNLRLTQPSLLVDVRGCADLREVTDEQDAIVYGAAITHAEIEDGAVPDVTGGWLAAAARGIAYRAVRTRGTLGGSLVHADPAADWLTVLLALGAEVIVQSRDGVSALGLAAFVRGPFTTTLAKDALLVGVRVAKRSPAARFGVCKLAVKQGEFAQALAAVLDDPDRGERRMVVGAVEQAPILFDAPDEMPTGVAAAEALLEGALGNHGAAEQRLHSVALARATQRLGDASAHA